MLPPGSWTGVVPPVEGIVGSGTEPPTPLPLPPPPVDGIGLVGEITGGTVTVVFDVFVFVAGAVEALFGAEETGVAIVAVGTC